MLLLDVSLRFPTITLFVVLFGLVVSQARKSQSAVFLSAWLMTMIGLLISTLPEALQLPWLVREIVWLLHLPNMVFLWWLALSLFIDNFKLKLIHWLVFALAVLLVVALRLFSEMAYQPGIDALIVFNRLMRLAMLLHMFLVALNGRANDLVEKRRSMRLWWVVGTLAYILVMLSAETLLFAFMGGHIYFTAGIYAEPVWFSTLRVVFLIPVILSGCLLFLRGHFDDFVTATTPMPAPSRPSIDARDSLAYSRLIQAMENDYLYRQTGLSIGQLAEHIRVPEHQLRALINQGLGYRNFSNFLNTYRLSEAKMALTDPNQARTPILTIATDVGYASLATFNRAFRSTEAMSPSQFRKSNLSESIQF